MLTPENELGSFIFQNADNKEYLMEGDGVRNTFLSRNPSKEVSTEVNWLLVRNFPRQQKANWLIGKLPAT